MLEYNRQKANPDPAIAKVKQAKAPMPEKAAEAKIHLNPLSFLT